MKQKTTYISILRGINVGGNKKILMADLKSIYLKLGYENVTTYIQSGNVIFNAPPQEIHLIEKTIAPAISNKYGFEVPVIVRTVTELEKIIEKNPFSKLAESGIDNLYLTFLKTTPTQEKVEELEAMSFSPDQFKIVNKEVYAYYAEKYSKSKFTNNLIEKKLKVTATTRNWKTTKKLLELGIECDNVLIG